MSRQSTRIVTKFLPSVLAAGIDWLLNDSFDDTLTAGNVNGTAATPGPGTRTVVDTGSDLSIASGDLTVAGGTSTYGDPGLWLDAVTRAAGVLMVGELTHTAGSTRCLIGFSDAQGGIPGWENAFHFQTSTGIYAQPLNTVVGTKVPGTSYYWAVVLRTTGAYYFVKGGAFASWTLLWHEATANTATVYPVSAGYSAVYTTSFLRVPDETWLPTPLAYTEFAAANGTSLDALPTLTTGPDSQAGVTARSWTEQSGDWDIQTNRANPDGAALATVDTSQADVVVDCVVNGGTAGQPAVLLRFADTSNYWFLQADRANNQFELHEYNATVDTVRANAAVTFNNSTDYDLRGICDGTTIDGFADGGNRISYGSAALNETETEHGLYADHTECEFDDFLAFARDSGYSKLDSYVG